MTKKEKLNEIIAVAKGLSGSEKHKADSITSFCMNSILGAIDTAIGNCSDNDMSSKARMRMASTVIAMLQDCILPVKIALGSIDADSCVDGTTIARDYGAIPENASIKVDAMYDEEGMHIKIEVGVEMEVPDDFMESLALSNEVGRA